MTTSIAMTVEEIQAKLSELKAQRTELEKTLVQMSKDAALAMVAGDDMNKFEENRLKTAEESRHVGELISSLEAALVEAAKNVDIQKLEKWLLKKQENSPLRQAAKQRLEAAKLEFKEAEADLGRLDEEWYGASRVIGGMRDKLKKEHKLSDIELNLIEAKFKP